MWEVIFLGKIIIFSNNYSDIVSCPSSKYCVKQHTDYKQMPWQVQTFVAINIKQQYHCGIMIPLQACISSNFIRNMAKLTATWKAISDKVISRMSFMNDNTLHKKWSFPLKISSVNMTKSGGNIFWGVILSVT